MFVNLKAIGLKRRTNNTSAIINTQIKFFVFQCKDEEDEDEDEDDEEEGGLHICVGTNVGCKVLQIGSVSL
jgi:hypothetical protein